MSIIRTLPTFSQTITFNGVFDQIASVPKSIVKFFAHRYADVRMLIRSFESMTGVPSRTIQQRIDEVKRFISTVENCGENRNQVKESFLALSPPVRGLFFNVDEGCIDAFIKEPSNTQEILRECNRVIEFQRMLTAVNAFFRRFNGVADTTEAPPENNGGGGSPPATPSPTRREEPRRPREEPARPRVPDLPQFSWRDLLNWEQLFGNQQQEAPQAPQERPRQEQPRNQQIPVHYENPDDDPFLHYWWTDVRDQMNRQQPQRPPARPVRQDLQINVNIAGTVAYDVRGSIPEEVRLKAIEIEGLIDRFEGLGRNKPAVPDIYMCNITKEPFMKIPLFDASHPNVNNPNVNNRNLRHAYEKDALERYIRSHTNHEGTPGEYWDVKCPVCRHPEHGGIRRQYVRIDTELQDQILQFLRNAVRGSR